MKVTNLRKTGQIPDQKNNYLFFRYLNSEFIDCFEFRILGCGYIWNILLFFILAYLFCSHTDVWYQMRRNNFELVEKGSYRGTLKYMPHPGQYEKLVNRYRQEIEKNLDLLPLITKQHFLVNEDLIYQYKFTWFDEKNNFLVLRYFAHIFNHPIYAGYQILFVYDTHKNIIIKICVSEVPLE